MAYRPAWGAAWCACTGGWGSRSAPGRWLAGRRELRPSAEDNGSMESELRRVAGIVFGAPLTRRTGHELLYCLTGGLAGGAGFVVTVVLLTSGFTVSASIIGTVIGLLLVTAGLRGSRPL